MPKLKLKSKPNCKDGNVTCGNKCQPKSYKCPSEKSPSAAVAVSKVSALLQTTATATATATESKPNLNDVYKSSQNLISTESKKAAREKIKAEGGGDTKAKLKELMKSEETAWVFVRLWREKERLLKKNSNDEAAKTILKTLNLIAEGDKTAIAEATKALRDSISTKKKLSLKSVDAVEATAAVIAAVSSSKAQTTLQPELLKTNVALLKRLSEGGIVSDSEVEGDFSLINATEGWALKNKTNRIRFKNSKISEIEARGLAAWISNNYKPINAMIYMSETDAKYSLSENERAYGISAGIRAMQALAKVDDKYKYSPAKLLAAKEALKGKGALRKTGELSRTIRVKDDGSLDKFLETYYESLKSGEPYVEKTFFAATAKKVPFSSNSNVEFIINAKTDDTSNGVLVDEFKNKLYEGEVLFPPFTKFKILKVVTPKEAAAAAIKKVENPITVAESKLLKKLKIDDDENLKSIINEGSSSSGDVESIVTTLSYILSASRLSAKGQEITPFMLKLSKGIKITDADVLLKIEKLYNKLNKYKEKLIKAENTSKMSMKSVSKATIQIFMEEI